MRQEVFSRVRCSRVALNLAIRVLAAFAVAASPGFAQTIHVDLVAKDVLEARLKDGLVSQGQRQGVIRGLFAEAGCAAEDQPVSKKFGNVICTLPGATDGIILVSGHSDFVEAGTGIVDDWTGTALLPSLYQSMISKAAGDDTAGSDRTLGDKARRHTFQFIAFAEEERGLVGSSYFVKHLSKEQRQKIRAVVNLECLGLTPPKVWSSRANKTLLNGLAGIAKSSQIELRGANVDRVGDDDTRPFLTCGIPVITIHSVTTETFGILHSSGDTFKVVNMTYYDDAYRLVALYLAFLDRTLQ
jgi:peptidase M28-like protein